MRRPHAEPSTASRRDILMPFQTTSEPLTLTPVVAVEFAGQLLISSREVNPCVNGINPFAPRHEISICLIISKPGFPPTIQPLCLNRLDDDFTIRVDPPNVGGSGVTAYAPTPEPFDPADQNNDIHDLRWAIDMNKLHAPDVLKTIPAGVMPGITLSDGVLYTIDKIEVLLACGGGQANQTTIAASIGAALSLAGAQQVILDWDEPAGPQTLALPRKTDPPNTTYIVSIINDPPFGTPRHDELAHYYNVLQKEDGSSLSRKCEIAVPPPDAPGPEMTDEIPCMPVIGP
jgi:hypothetical protein